MYLAPGTGARQNCFEKQTVWTTIWKTLGQVRIMTGQWIGLVWVASLIILTPVVLEFVSKNKEKFSKRFPICLILISFIIICAMFCVPYYAMASFGTGRLTNAIWLTFMLLSIVVYTAIVGYLSANNILDIEKIRKIKHLEMKSTMTVIAFLGILYICPNNLMWSNSLAATKELITGEAKRYAEEMDKRLILYNDPSLEVVAVESIKNKSGLLTCGDIGTNKDEWPNTSVSEWYHKKGIYRIEENSKQETST